MWRKTGRIICFRSGSEVFFHAVRRTSSLPIEKHGQCRIREVEKAPSKSPSIKAMFANERLRISQSSIPTDKTSISQLLEKKDGKKTIKARAVQDISKLMRLKKG